MCQTVPSRQKKSAECNSISGAGTGRSTRTASLPVSLARAFRRVPVPSTQFVRRQAGPLAPRLRMAATAFSLRGAFSGSGTVWSPRRGFIMPDTSNRHDPKLGVELMRRYCDPRRDFGLGLRRPCQSTSPVPAMQPDQRSLHSPTGRTFRRYLRLLFGPGRPHDRRPCWRSM